MIHNSGNKELLPNIIGLVRGSDNEELGIVLDDVEETPTFDAPSLEHVEHLSVQVLPDEFFEVGISALREVPPGSRPKALILVYCCVIESLQRRER